MIAPCIVCGRTLREVFLDHSDNQPNEGVVAVISGNYGSTVFDPFDGTHLEINVCDECLTQAGSQGRVLSGRRQRPVSMGGFRVGYERVDVPLVQWRRGLAGYEGDELVLDEDEDLTKLPKTVYVDPEAWANALKLLEAEYQK